MQSPIFCAVALSVWVAFLGCQDSSGNCERLRTENEALRNEVHNLRAALADANLGMRPESGDSATKGAWPRAAKAAYVDRCADQMMAQSMPGSYARPYCECIANGMEKEFGTAEYTEMMNAQPKADGTVYDRRLYDVLMSCSEELK